MTFIIDMSIELFDVKGKKKNKVIYLIVFEDGNFLRNTLIRICESFNS
jgi:hypothetical protein